MREPALDALVPRRVEQHIPLHRLMPRRIHNILLVSSLYDSFTFQEDGNLSRQLFQEYFALNLNYAPRVRRVSNGDQALQILEEQHFDLIISRVPPCPEDILAFSRDARSVASHCPHVLLAHNRRELQRVEQLGRLPDIDRVFIWNGSQSLFMAIIKSVEDQLNVDHDQQLAGVYSIILVEDSVRFYSTYLPGLYHEVVKQTQAVMSDSVNSLQGMTRMKARPKILLATNYEEAIAMMEKRGEHVLGLIVDAAFPRNGTTSAANGPAFIRRVREARGDLPVLLQSSGTEIQRVAHELGVQYANKNSPELLAELHRFIKNNLGFGDFVFRNEAGYVFGAARDLQELASKVASIPDESILYHASHNHFSTWLMARTEFEAARAMRSVSVNDFSDVGLLRQYLSRAVESIRVESGAGLVADFSRRSVGTPNMFVSIGSGSLGGKGRGLAFLNRLLSNYDLQRLWPEIRFYVPPTAILATDVFDAFLELNRLVPKSVVGLSDEEIDARFEMAELPHSVLQKLREFLQFVHYPLAVRSSSLLEDSSSQPFAGVYDTHMVPNNHADTEVRLKDLVRAIILVYASTFHEDARAYLEATDNRLEEEKMAVVVQQVVGRTHKGNYYPDISGTCRSRNFYPMPGMRPEDGILSVALGLGKTVNDGGRCLRFSPEHPTRLYQFSTIQDCLDNAQREFYALNLEATGGRNSQSVVLLDLKTAEEHGTLHPVGSVYSPDNDAVYDGIARPGYRLVSMAGVLKGGMFPLASVASYLMKVGEASLSGPVEMEFAVNLRSSSGQPHELALLQIRPLGIDTALGEMNLDAVDATDVLCSSSHALGHGLIEGVRDIVYVKPTTFDRGQTTRMAEEIGSVNARLLSQGRSFVLVGQGRWGTADRWLGIPVSWSQISRVACIVETDMADYRVEPSQGTHFFQNITSLGIGYLTVHFADGDVVDYGWLDRQPAEFEGPFVRHVRLEAPLAVAMDGRSRRGTILKHANGLTPGNGPSGGESGDSCRHF